MSVWVLGPLLTDDGPLSPRERSVLSALILRAGFPVSPDELADAVWGDDPPATWPKQLQASIGRLRRSLGARTIATGATGYTIILDLDSIDAHRFDRLVDAARSHAIDGDPARAADALDRALELWRGAPYPDLPAWPPAVIEAERLAEVRVEAEELRLGARLALGEHDSAIAGAERLVREQPLREQRWALLATALYRSGRQADALAAIRAARTRLDDELGIEPGEDLRRLELAILQHDSGLELGAPPATPSDVCPYRGLTPFGVEDEDDFFGRDADIEAALGRLARSPFLAVTGASGSGKSSLVRAGLVPVLGRRGDRVVILTPSNGLGIAIRDAISRQPGAQVIVVDQFEELFHAGVAEPEVGDAARAVADAIEHGASVILVVRSDFLDECAAQPDLGRLFAQGVHLVGPMSPDSLRDAIEQPARRAGLRLESGLTELILRDAAGGSGSLPHVSHALVETWLRREGGTLTVAGYEASGGISGAIAQSADRLYQSLDANQRALCRSTLARLVVLAPDGSPVRRRVPSRALRADASRDEVLSLLADARLVSTEADSVAIAHESLATAWPRLHLWLEEDAESSRVLTTLSAAAENWDAAGRPEEDLARGARLQSAREWQDAEPRDLTGTESAFLAASVAREASEQEALAERARRDRRQNRRLRVILAVAVTLFAVAVTASGIVAASLNETAKQRTTAQIEALTSTALSLRGTGRDAAALLAVEAYQRWPDDPRTRSALMGVMTRSQGLLATTYLTDVTDMAGALVPGTRHAVVTTVDGAVAIYDIDTGERIRRLDIPWTAIGADSRYGPAVSGDGSRVAVAELRVDDTGAMVGVLLSVAEIESGALVLAPMTLDYALSSITMNHEGDTVAAIDQVGAVRLIDADTGTTRIVAGTSTHEAQWNTDRAGAVRFTPEGRLLYGTVEGQLLVIDPGAAAVVASVPMPEESTNVSMAVLSDTRVIATGDRRISAVDLATAAVEWSQVFATASDEPCPWVTVSVELDTVYCGDLFGRIAERSLSTGAPTDRSFDPHLGFVGTMAVADDGRELVVVGRGRAITRWRLDWSGAVSRLLAPGWSILDRYSPTGSRIVVARRTEDLESWEDYREFAVLDTRSGELSAQAPIPSYGVMWASDETLVGDFGGIGPARTGFLDVRTGVIRDGDPLPDDNIDAWMDSAGDRLYVARPGGEIWTFDSATGRRVDPTLRTDGGDPAMISTSSDGSRVLVTSWNMEFTPDTIEFDAATGERLNKGLIGVAVTALTARDEVVGAASHQEISRFDADTFERLGALPGVSGGLDTIYVSADGRTLSAYSLNETVSVYDLVGGIRLGDPIAVSSQWAYSGVFRSDGTELAVNAPTGIVVWDLRPSSHAEAACEMAGRDLTRDEWIAYLSALGAYRSTCGFGEG